MTTLSGPVDRRQAAFIISRIGISEGTVTAFS
jgi:hypothetical protein